MSRIQGPRIYCIPAAAAPVVAVLRRGPSEWCHVGRWDVERWTWEPGAWLRGRLFPQKCDLSPDGRWLACSIHKPSASWPAGTIYESISRLPWLHALAAWEAGTTYTRGIHFVESGTNEIGEPDVGDAGPCLARYGLRVTRALQFAVERRRGWSETEDTPPRHPNDVWDERRAVRMRKPQPSGIASLEIEGSYGAFRSMPDYHDPVSYSVVRGDVAEPLDNAQWADWTHEGMLLLATTDGRLQGREIGDGTDRLIFEQDLAALAPDPSPAPGWAHEW